MYFNQVKLVQYGLWLCLQPRAWNWFKAIAGVNFINVFTRSLYVSRYWKLKKDSLIKQLLGSAGVKDACEMMVKLTPGVIFHEHRK